MKNSNLKAARSELEEYRAKSVQQNADYIDTLVKGFNSAMKELKNGHCSTLDFVAKLADQELESGVKFLSDIEQKTSSSMDKLQIQSTQYNDETLGVSEMMSNQIGGIVTKMNAHLDQSVQFSTEATDSLNLGVAKCLSVIGNCQTIVKQEFGTANQTLGEGLNRISDLVAKQSEQAAQMKVRCESEIESFHNENNVFLGKLNEKSGKTRSRVEAFQAKEDSQVKSVKRKVTAFAKEQYEVL